MQCIGARVCMCMCVFVLCFNSQKVVRKTKIQIEGTECVYTHVRNDNDNEPVAQQQKRISKHMSNHLNGGTNALFSYLSSCCLVNVCLQLCFVYLFVFILSNSLSALCIFRSTQNFLV